MRRGAWLMGPCLMLSGCLSIGYSDLASDQTMAAIRVGAPLTVAGGNPEAETKRLQTVMSELLDTAIRAYPERDDASWWTPRSVPRMRSITSPGFRRSGWSLFCVPRSPVSRPSTISG